MPGRCDDPGFELHLRHLITEFRLESQVEMPGLLKPKVMKQLYTSAGILAFPTYHHEGCPRVILEAMAMGLPVVVYDTGGAAAAVKHGVSGYVVPSGQLPEFIDRVDQLLAAPLKRVEMGDAGRASIMQDYSYEALAERHERFYLDILAR